MSNFQRSYSRPTNFSRVHERPVKSACYKKRGKKTDHDYSTTNCHSNSNRYDLSESQKKIKKGLALKFHKYNTNHEIEALRSTHNGNQTLDKKQMKSLKMGKAFNNFMKEDSSQLKHKMKRKNNSKPRLMRYHAKQGSSTSKSGNNTAQSNFNEALDFKSRQKDEISLSIEQRENNMRYEILHKFEKQGLNLENNGKKKYHSTLHRIQHLKS